MKILRITNMWGWTRTYNQLNVFFCFWTVKISKHNSNSRKNKKNKKMFCLFCSTILCTEWAMLAAPDWTLRRLKSDTCCSERSMTCCRRSPHSGWVLCSLITSPLPGFLSQSTPEAFHPIKIQYNCLLSEKKVPISKQQMMMMMVMVIVMKLMM